MAKAKVSEKLKSEYRMLLAQARAEGNKAVGNRYPWQCQAAINALSQYAADRQKMFGNSETPVTIRILTGTLPNYVFGCPVTTTALTDFFASGGKLKVIVWATSLDVKGNSLCQLAKTFSRAAEIRLSRTDALSDQLNHFFVVNDEAYRLEEPHSLTPPERFDDFEPEIPAKIIFEHKQGGAGLVKFFDAIWESVTPIA